MAWEKVSWVGAYPRRHGGNTPSLPQMKPGWGLSPQARGKLSKLKINDQGEGPIPAGTGETQNPPVRPFDKRAYPRRHGGNFHHNKR